MGSVIHIAEIAAILAVAYSLGWVLGFAARRLATPRALPAAIPEARLAAVTAGGDALVKAPSIAPVAGTVPPAVDRPADTEAEPIPDAATPEPVASSAEAVPASPEVSPPTEVTATQPAAMEEASPDATESPMPAPAVAIGNDEVVPEVAPAPVEAAVTASVESGYPAAASAESSSPAVRMMRRFRPAPRAADPAEPEAIAPVVLTSSPTSRPGLAWNGEVRGKVAQHHSAVPSPPELLQAEPVTIPAPVPVAAAEATAPVADEPLDEDAAMRAIEGGWSRVRTRALPDSPELTDVGAAVAAATTAVEKVLATAGIDPSAEAGRKPQGLPRPRGGAKDDLKQINGLGALDESTLNNLGIYHYDQIAGWDLNEVGWMETHVFARGRIGREDWQRQARELAAKTAA